MEAMLFRLGIESPLGIPAEQREYLLSASEVLRQENTGIAGKIRVLRVADIILVQEETPTGEILLRTRPDRDAANAFVERRLRQYDKMWDG